MISPRCVSADDLRRAWLTEWEVFELERLRCGKERKSIY